MSANAAEFTRKYGPTALILGGSEGIGRQFAEQLAARGLALVLIARGAEPLEMAAAEIRASHGTPVTTYSLDLATPDLESVARQLTSSREIGLLVCNAGATHGAGLFVDEPLGKALGLARLNCTTPLTFAHPLLTAMRARGHGGLIVVSSMSGLVGSGLIATYAAAKAFQIALCEGLNWELARDGVDVMCAVAGLTDTPAMRRSGLSFKAAAERGFVAMQAADVARGALENLGRTAVWYAVGGQAAAAMHSVPREELTVSMTETAAALYQVPLRSQGT